VLGHRINKNLGCPAGNRVFGFILCMTGTISAGIGLPLDIRHIAFTSANLAQVAVALEMNLSLAGVLSRLVIGCLISPPPLFF
jgi:site-specific recombinase